jgi:Flp pilus assembly protein TadD
MRSASFRFLAVVVLLAGCAPREPTEAELAELDRGVGLMGKFEFAQAHELFARLAERHPRWFEARFNVGVAALNRQAEGDERAAAALMRTLLEDHPGEVHAVYTLGLIALRGEPPKNAELLLRQALENDPRDAYTAYFLGQAVLAQGRAAEALQLFEGAERLDRRLRSAQYAAAQALARLGRASEAEARMAEFQRQANNPLSRLAEFKYTRMGPKSEALPAVRAPAAVALPSGAVFAGPEMLLKERPLVSKPVPSAADVDGDGEVDLYIPGGFGHRGTVLVHKGGKWLVQPDHPLAAPAGIEFAAWGDLDNDGLTDVLLCRAEGTPVVFINQKSGWKALAVPALEAVRGARDCALLDADHDGDLDIFIVSADGARELVSNNADGSFRSLTARLPKPPAGRASQLVAADLNNDRSVDLVVLHADGAHEALDNELLWSWRTVKGFEGVARLPAVAAAAGDPQATGELELLVLTPQLAVQRWRRQADGAWQAQPFIPGSDAPRREARAQIALADLDGDGSPEVLATSSRGLAASRTTGEPLWQLDDPGVISWALANLDARGPSLVTLRADGSLALHAPGPGRGRFVRIALSGRQDPAASIRSNASGIGARVAARAGGRWVAGHTLREGSGPGQSLAPLALGVGNAPGIDYLRIDWSDGTFQTETGLAGPAVLRIAETQRQLSSCPLLFAWDGGRYAFVSDFLGVGGLGYLLAPGEYAPPRPWENFLFPTDLLQPADGRYHIKVAEPMEEAGYFDALRLVAYDLPPGWQMALDERMQIGEPKVSGRPLYYRRALLPERALNERGEDVTDTVREADRRAADPGKLDHRFIGRLAGEHVLTLHFENSIEASSVLVIDGWIEYPYSQTMFAAWQAKAAYQAPTLEARGGDGAWRVVLKEFGYPAGMPRTMAVPLPRLPAGTRALRLRTNQQIYWDRIAVARVEDAKALRNELKLLKAEMRETGFPRRTTGPQHQPDYDYAQRSPLWDTRVQAGHYTEFGGVAELLAQEDQALAIIGPGEEIHVEFSAELPALAEGWTRRFVLETHGWAKDMDLYTRDRDTLAPLPVPDTNHLHRKFNRRPM